MHKTHDLSALHLHVHALCAYAFAGIVLVDKASTASALLGYAFLTIAVCVSLGYYMDGGIDGLMVERARCYGAAVMGGFVLLSSESVQSSLARTVALSLFVIAHVISSVLMTVYPARFMRTAVRE